jgi:hypothetical protein
LLRTLGFLPFAIRILFSFLISALLQEIFCETKVAFNLKLSK